MIGIMFVMDLLLVSMIVVIEGICPWDSDVLVMVWYGMVWDGIQVIDT